MKTYNAFFGKNATDETARRALEQHRRETVAQVLDRGYSGDTSASAETLQMLDRATIEEQEAGYVEW